MICCSVFLCVAGFKSLSVVTSICKSGNNQCKDNVNWHKMQKAYKFVRVILGILVVLSVVLVEFAMYWQILDKSGGISAECLKINFWHFAFDLHKFFVDLQEFYNLQ